jgi:hypothetical protein
MTIAARIHQRRIPTVTKTVKIMLKHNSHRHGNCMNCIFGKSRQNTEVTENINPLQAIAHATTPFQTKRFFSRQREASPAATATAMISSSAIHEMIRLNAS